MNFDALSIAAIISELQNTVIDGRIQRVTQINSLNFAWEIFVHPTRYYLNISVAPQTPYLYLSQQKARRGSGHDTPLMLVLRKYMRGARLRAIEQPPYERLLYLYFDNYAGPTIVVIELLGTRSNLLLLETDQTILGVARLSKMKEKVRQRVLIPGQIYEPPPPQTKLDPAHLTEFKLQQEITESSPEFPVVRLLPQIIQGVSPQMAREITYRATGNIKTPVAELTTLGPLLTACRQLFDHLWHKQWQPTIALNEEHEPVALAPYSLSYLPHTQTADSFSAIVESYLAESSAAYAAAKTPLQEALDEARRKLSRRRDRLQEDAASRANPELLKQKGEMILAQAHEIEAGQSSLTVSWLPDQSPLTIDLDPAMSASENAQHYFQRYRKALRSAEEIPAQFDKIELEEQYLEQLEQDLTMADNREEIDSVGDSLRESGYYQPTKRRQKGRQRASRYLRLTAPDGATVWVGKNASQNAHLTFNRASADDLWLHARNIPGAHVIIPTAQGLPSEEDVFWAASVAAYYSRARHDTSVEVDVTLKKYVRAIKGAAPGLVTYRQESTFRVPPELPDLD